MDGSEESVDGVSEERLTAVKLVSPSAAAAGYMSTDAGDPKASIAPVSGKVSATGGKVADRGMPHWLVVGMTNGGLSNGVRGEGNASSPASEEQSDSSESHSEHLLAVLGSLARARDHLE
jgi:hypothetical protein